jgi:hypothetical protein
MHCITCHLLIPQLTFWMLALCFDLSLPAGAAASNAPPGQLWAASGRGNGSSKAVAAPNSQSRSAGVQGAFENDKERLLQLQQQLLGAQAELRSARCVKSAADLDCLILTEDSCVSQRTAYPERVLIVCIHTLSINSMVCGASKYRHIFHLSSAAYPAAWLCCLQCSFSLCLPMLGCRTFK